MIDANIVKELREKTGAGIMDCKTALSQTGGDVEKAIVYLREKGTLQAAKKSERQTTEGIIGSYVHSGGKIAVLVEVNCETDFVARNEEFQELVKDLAMQVAGSFPEPLYVSKEEVPSEILEKEKQIYIKQAEGSGKPPAVIEKIASGKLDKYLSEICLSEQSFIKNPDIKIKDLLNQKIAKIGENIQIKRFVKYKVGN
ncbi:MAG: translation elongation factor Ts [Nitrospirae bacterium]|nr:translation elongation factor Ts [Nitrospirota bacterium]MBI3353172.1 translation elongation factor Ts [Nitrospirota bacterium]